MIYLNGCKTKEQQLKFILDTNDPEIFYGFSFLFENDLDSLNILSDAVLEFGNDYWIKVFYNNIDFDKSKYESYFRNLIFK